MRWIFLIFLTIKKRRTMINREAEDPSEIMSYDEYCKAHDLEKGLLAFFSYQGYVIRMKRIIRANQVDRAYFEDYWNNPN